MGMSFLSEFLSQKHAQDALEREGRRRNRGLQEPTVSCNFGFPDEMR